MGASLDRQAGITAEMVEAATKILWESGRVASEVPGADHLVVREMLEAAFLRSLPLDKNSPSQEAVPSNSSSIQSTT